MMRLGFLLSFLFILGCAPAEMPAQEPAITNFEECAAAGNPVMESYPRQCNADGQNFVEVIATNPEPPASEMIPEEPVSTPVSAAKPRCGDGTCDYNENCDTCFDDCACESPAECYRGRCKVPECGGPGDCKDNDTCTVDTCEFAQHPNAYCLHDLIEECKNNDGCCARGCDANTDVDCRPICGNKICEVGETDLKCEEDCAEEETEDAA